MATKLRRLKKRSGKSLRQLEQDTFISDSTISRYINRTILPDWSTLECLLNALGGDKEEFRILRERARRDFCALGVRRDSADLDLDANSVPAGREGGGWADCLLATIENSGDDQLARLLDTILALTRQMGETESMGTLAALQQARAVCWSEIGAAIDTGTAIGSFCAQACKYAGEIDAQHIATR